MRNETDDEKRQVEGIGFPSLRTTVTSNSTSLETAPLLVTVTPTDPSLRNPEPQPKAEVAPILATLTQNDSPLVNREPEPKAETPQILATLTPNDSPLESPLPQPNAETTPLLATLTPNDSPLVNLEPQTVSLRRLARTQPLPNLRNWSSNSSTDSSVQSCDNERDLKYRQEVTTAWLDHCFETKLSRDGSASSSSSTASPVSLSKETQTTVASIYYRPER